jgi:hypothetical protein
VIEAGEVAEVHEDRGFLGHGLERWPWPLSIVEVKHLDRPRHRRMLSRPFVVAFGERPPWSHGVISPLLLGQSSFERP